MTRRTFNFNRKTKPDPTETMRGVQARVDAIDAKPIIPGHFNATLGMHLKRDGGAPDRIGREHMTEAKLAERKARITLAKVW